MSKQKYFCDKAMRERLINTIRDINRENGKTVLRWGCGIYVAGCPQDVTVIGENDEAIENLNARLWG